MTETWQGDSLTCLKPGKELSQLPEIWQGDLLKILQKMADQPILKIVDIHAVYIFTETWNI